jgi:outer membrane autotransporter protein
VGIALRRTTGPWQYGAAITYGWSSADVTRYGAVTDSFTATASRDLQLLSGIVGGSYQWDIDRFFIRGLADLGVTYLQTGDAKESGAGALNLSLDDQAETLCWLRPGAEFGYAFDPFGNGLQLRAFGIVNLLQYLTDPNTQVGAGIEGAPSGVPKMQVDVPLGQTAMQYGLGIELTSGQFWSAALRYSASFSEHSQIDAWTLNVSLNW